MIVACGCCTVVFKLKGEVWSVTGGWFLNGDAQVAVPYIGSVIVNMNAGGLRGRDVPFTIPTVGEEGKAAGIRVCPDADPKRVAAVRNPDLAIDVSLHGDNCRVAGGLERSETFGVPGVTHRLAKIHPRRWHAACRVSCVDADFDAERRRCLEQIASRVPRIQH